MIPVKKKKIKVEKARKSLNNDLPNKLEESK
jgi:hypothetical protein